MNYFRVFYGGKKIKNTDVWEKGAGRTQHGTESCSKGNIMRTYTFITFHIGLLLAWSHKGWGKTSTRHHLELDPAQESRKRWALVNAAMNLRVSPNKMRISPLTEELPASEGLCYMTAVRKLYCRRLLGRSERKLQNIQVDRGVMWPKIHLAQCTYCGLERSCEDGTIFRIPQHSKNLLNSCGSTSFSKRPLLHLVKNYFTRT